jgi:uroporphyrinogen decarboxylase
VNAIHPIEPKAMDILEVKKRYGGKLCVIGNIDLGYTLTRGSPEETESEVKEKLRTVAPGGGYCLGSSNSIPEYVKPENFRAMVETTKKYGKYPISL